MQRYLNQLIADMKEAAENLPPKPIYDIPPEAEGIEYVIEWENATEKPMHEWMGIGKENFPPPEKLSNDELDMMVDEILKLWAAYNIHADLPENLPAGIAYKLLVDYFDKPVAWISEGTLHVEFCDYEPENCPFPEEFCMCRDLGKESDIPVKYREVVKKIAENNNCGFVCFVNPDTGEMEEAMPEWLEDPNSLEDVVDQEWDEMYTFENWDRVITIEPPESHESFKIMEDFAEFKVSGKLQEQLFAALNRRKPFRNFKYLIDESEYRQDWFAYKQMRLEERAWTLIFNELPKEDFDDILPF